MGKAPLKQWTAEDAEKILGRIVHQDDKFVVRMKYDDKNPTEIHLHVHYVRGGKEQIPMGYILGSNALTQTWKP